MKLSVVVYSKIESVPGDYFRCDRYGLMSAASCGRNYRSAPAAAREGRLGGCLGCEVGAAHCGGPANATRPGPVLVCARCRRGADQFTNSIGRVRMVRGGTICVSCFNREREVLAGRNAKGTKPKLALHAVTVALVEGGHLEVARIPVAKDRLEGALTVMRRGGAASMTTWVSGGVAHVVLEDELA